MHNITYIRDGRKIMGFRYRDVLVVRNDSDGVTLWEWEKMRFQDGHILCQAKSTKAAAALIDETLKKGRRDWYAKLVEYVVNEDGILIDARLLNPGETNE